jgi:hypothetical protein
MASYKKFMICATLVVGKQDIPIVFGPFFDQVAIGGNIKISPTGETVAILLSNGNYKFFKTYNNDIQNGMIPFSCSAKVEFWNYDCKDVCIC